MSILLRTDSHIIAQLLEAFDDSNAYTQYPRTGTKSFTGLQALLNEGQVNVKSLQLLVFSAIVISSAVALLAGLAYSLCLFIVCVSSIYPYVWKKIAKRRQELDRDLPALLTTIASSVRAGLDPLVALSNARDYFSVNGVIRAELERFHKAISNGEDEDKLINSFCSTVKHPDMPLVRACLSLARRHGSSLAEPLHRVIRVVRQRQSFRRKTRGALVMHRMSAIGIVLCAILIGTMQGIMNAQGIRQTLAHPTGSKILFAGAVLIAAGVVWMMTLGGRDNV